MSRHPVSRLALLLTALLALVIAPASAGAVRPAQGPAQASPTTVSGTLQLPGGGSVTDTVVRYAPLTAAGAFDWARAASAPVYLGTFSFSVAAPGQYGLEIDPPQNETSARPLRGYTFTVAQGAASLNLGAISLPAASKRITGTVTFRGPGGDVGLQGVRVYAVNASDETFLTTTTVGPTGAFGFGVAPGDWEVYTVNLPGTSWQVADPPVRIRFANNTQAESASAPIVAYRTVGALTGRVLGPGGAPIPAPGGGGDRPFIHASGQRGFFGRYEVIDSTGAFTIPVMADTYTLQVVVDQGDYPSLAAPPPAAATVVSGTVAVPTITLQQASARISGVVSDAGGPLSEVEVQAFADDGRWRGTITAPDGSYTLNLTAGDWAVDVTPDEAGGYLAEGDFARVFVADGQTATQNFALTRAAAIVTGGFVEAGGSTAPLPDVRGWAYARDAAGDFVAWGPVEQGSFSLNVPAGPLSIGVQLAPGSPFALSREVALAPAGALGAAQAGPPPSRSVTLELLRADAVISGTLRDAVSNTPITGVPAVVALIPADAGRAFQWADVDSSTGQFSAAVPAGTWSLAHELAEGGSTSYVVPETGPVTVRVAAGGSASADLFLAPLDGLIVGTLTSGGAPVQGRLVWVTGEIYTASARSGADGTFSIPVPTKGPGGVEARYIIGTDFACVTVADCYFDIEPRPAVVTGATPNRLRPAQALNNNLDANPVGGNGADLVGLVVGTNGQPLSGQSVRNGSSGGISSATEVGNVTTGGTFSRGGKTYNFTLPIAYQSGGRPARVSGRIRIAGTNFNVDTAIDSGLRIGAVGPYQSIETALAVDPFAGLPAVPPAVFDVRNGYTTTLVDGTQIEIPSGAVPLSSADRNEAGQGVVRVTITPTYNLISTRQFGEAGLYGFEIALTAVASGRPITENLLAPMRMTLRYGAADISENGIRKSQLRAARRAGQEWVPADAFVPDPANNRLSFQTTRLGLWALVQQRQACGECVFLPYVGRR